MTQKAMVVDAISELPDDSPLEQIAYRVQFLAPLQKGLEQIDKGETVTHEQLKRELTSWLTN